MHGTTIKNKYIGVLALITVFIYYADSIIGTNTILLPSLLPIIYAATIKLNKYTNTYGIIILIMAAFAAEQAVSSSRLLSGSTLNVLFSSFEMSDYYFLWLVSIWYLINMTPSILSYAISNLIKDKNMAVNIISYIVIIAIILLTILNMLVLLATSFE